MRKAQVENGVVVNVVLADEDFAQEHGLVACPDDIGPGDLYDGSAFSKRPPPVTVPLSVTRRQGMAVLIEYGLDTEISAMLAGQLAAANNSGNAAAVLAAKLALNDFNESQEFHRDWPLIEAVRQLKGWSSEYVDSLFLRARTL